jgi:anti-sigma regulatory factor (Ser/Thr protein kinase)
VIHNLGAQGMAHNPAWSHQIDLVAEPASAGLARDFVCLHLVAHSLLYLVQDIRLVVSELATNALQHAQTPFVVTLSMTGGVVLLTLQDESQLIPIRSAPGVMDMSGRGLMIVELLSHEWGISTDDRGSKSVWASFLERRR